MVALLERGSKAALKKKHARQLFFHPSSPQWCHLRAVQEVDSILAGMTNPLPPGAESQTGSAWDWRQTQLLKGNTCWCVCTHAPICLEYIYIILLLIGCINDRITSIYLFYLSSKKTPTQTSLIVFIYILTYIRVFNFFLYYANVESDIIFVRYWWSDWSTNCQSTSILGRSPSYFGLGCMLETSPIQIYFSPFQQVHGICIKNLHNCNKTETRQ